MTGWKMLLLQGIPEKPSGYRPEVLGQTAESHPGHVCGKAPEADRAVRTADSFKAATTGC